MNKIVARRRSEDRRLTLGAILGVGLLMVVLSVAGCATGAPDPEPSTMAIRHAEVWCTYAGFVGDELQSCINVVASEFEGARDG